MIEKKLATRPARPAQLTKSASTEPSPRTARIASGSGLSLPRMVSEPAAPGTMSRISAANSSSVSIAVMMPRGMSRAGSLVSSAASGTPSTARKNQMP